MLPSKAAGYVGQDCSLGFVTEFQSVHVCVSSLWPVLSNNLSLFITRLVVYLGFTLEG